VIITQAVKGADYKEVTSANVTATVTDINPFAFVRIGAQTWSASNVSLVPNAPYNVLNRDYWTTYDVPNQVHRFTGYYYTWQSAMNVCPRGWRLPSDRDWKILEAHVSLTGVTGIDRTGWRGNAGNGQGIGEKLWVGGGSGFEGHFEGFRDYDPIGNPPYPGFSGIYADTRFWSSTVLGHFGYGMARGLNQVDTGVWRDWVNMRSGLSVRCIADF
jgi:uncharacterized protein (TIGR02145 family)